MTSTPHSIRVSVKLGTKEITRNLFHILMIERTMLTAISAAGSPRQMVVFCQNHQTVLKIKMLPFYKLFNWPFINFGHQVFLLYCPPTSKNASVSCPSEHDLTAFIRASKPLLPSVIAAFNSFKASLEISLLDS